MKDLILRHRTMLFWQNVATKNFYCSFKGFRPLRFYKLCVAKLYLCEKWYQRRICKPWKSIFLHSGFLSSPVSGLLFIPCILYPVSSKKSSWNFQSLVIWISFHSGTKSNFTANERGRNGPIYSCKALRCLVTRRSTLVMGNVLWINTRLCESSSVR